MPICALLARPLALWLCLAHLMGANTQCLRVACCRWLAPAENNGAIIRVSSCGGAVAAGQPTLSVRYSRNGGYPWFCAGRGSQSAAERPLHPPKSLCMCCEANRSQQCEFGLLPHAGMQPRAAGQGRRVSSWNSPSLAGPATASLFQP